MSDLGNELRRIWEDQRAFNMLFRNPPTEPSEVANQARDFVLFTESELHELLRTLPWKKHRRMPFRSNNAHMHEEGADIFKCVLSLFQIIGIETPEQLVELYWTKTAVVRQRYREEWIEKLDRECAVIDIDNVICDYIGGICQWLIATKADSVDLDKVNDAWRHGRYINAERLGIKEELWQSWKHEFRTGGFKRYLPVFDDARRFLEMCKIAQLRIVLLTSRPIDRYQNLFTDTIMWLNSNQLPFDFVWWSLEKAERILMEDGLREKVRFAVDDDQRFVRQFARAGIRTYWLRRGEDWEPSTEEWNSKVIHIQSLNEITF